MIEESKSEIERDCPGEFADYVKTTKSLDDGTTSKSWKDDKKTKEATIKGDVRTIDQGQTVVKGETKTTWNKAPKNAGGELNPTTPDYDITNS